MLLAFSICHDEHITNINSVMNEDGSINIIIIGKDGNEPFSGKHEIRIPSRLLQDIKDMFKNIEAWELNTVKSYVEILVKSVNDTYEKRMFEISSYGDVIRFNSDTILSIPDFELIKENNNITLLNENSTEYFYIYIP